MSDTLKQLTEAVIAGNATLAGKITEQALAEGIAPTKVLTDGLIAGMSVVGVRFKAEEIFVPEVLIAARAMKTGVEILRPRLAGEAVPMAGTIVLGTVQGDLHDIGKNLVAMMMEGVGFKVIDLGVNVAPERFVEAINEHEPDLVGMSALLTTTMPMMKETLEAFKAAGVRGRVKVVVGGAPVNENFARQIGADGYAPDAGSAADLAKALVVTG